MGKKVQGERALRALWKFGRANPEEQRKGTRELPSSSESQIYQSSETAYIDLDPETCSDDSRLDPSYEEREDFPQISDEIMVNAYLLGLASVVTFPIEGVEAHWTPERKGYKVCDEKGIKLYEARTDGHMYLNSNGKTNAIAEDKPVVRAELPGFMMQEVAQMAAWIHAEKDVIQDENLAEQCSVRVCPLSETQSEILILILHCLVVLVSLSLKYAATVRKGNSIDRHIA
ncbi:uncharacterized protein BO87DRAFT_385583 [Aspergillus neoniger CBS 115656]|uniref:Uncharacterized protein n=1 Tax=Aspergillus neoniger (strain CBS 115656) TaxID=1448310 RepID=A0A318YN88_ASPNB|nr:hypothetical protein BO87DRAFT_385583 [Aspergillus neoniger CBS 115656]PYH35307.1 hypothetical protein BO87DRAFT_385583 [Aspergillus neoniger CBS 115656]